MCSHWSGSATAAAAAAGGVGADGGLGRLQTFLCVAYVGSDAVVGCASGELYRFRGRQLVQIMQASACNDSGLVHCALDVLALVS